MDKQALEEHLIQPLQTNIQQFRIAVTFPTGYNGIFNVTNSNNKIYSLKSVNDEDGYFQINFRPGAYEIESLNKEIKRISVDEKHYTEANYPFTTKPNFPTLGSIVEISTQGPVITFAPDDSIGDLQGFNRTTKF